FDDYCRRFTDLPLLVQMERSGEHLVPGRLVRAADFGGALAQTSHADWKTVGFDERTGEVSVPQGSIGFRWGDAGHWNVQQKDARDRREISMRLSLLDTRDDVAEVAFPYFGAAADRERILRRRVPVKRLALRGGPALVATVFDLLVASYGIDRGLGGEHVAASYDDDVPYTPAWQAHITGVARKAAVAAASEIAQTADTRRCPSTAISGCRAHQAYRSDMSCRAVIDMLILCGCAGVPGGGWAHSLGQENLPPQVGWATLA